MLICIKEKKDCCGCNACGDVCAQQAISFKTDIEGFWYPEVDKQKCVDCGLCEKVCPVINIKDLKKNDLEEPVCYAAEHNNLEVIFDSTSGGLFSALAEIMYRSGGYVGGAIYNDDFSVRHFISKEKTDLPKLRSSKYLQSSLEGFYRQVKSLVVKGENVLVCGTPCQMAGLRAFLRKDYDNLIIVDFVCRGINSPKAVKKYLQSFEERYGSPVVYVKSKSKEYGWRNLTNKVILADGRHIYETKQENRFTKAYLSTNAVCRPSCYECQFKGFPRMADITLADFWGIEKVKPEMDKDLGTSMVMINSQKGLAYFERVKSRIKYVQVPTQSAVAGNPAFLQPLGPPKVDRDQFFKDLDQMPFSSLPDEYFKGFPVSRKKKAIQFVRRVQRLITELFGSTTSTLKTLCHSRIKDILHGNYILIRKHCVIDISRKANVRLKGRLYVGNKKFKRSKLETRLLVEKGASLISDGDVSLGYGSDVEVFKGAKLHLKGHSGANTNLTIICANHIEIGKDVMIGRGVTIRDNNGDHYINRPGYKTSKPVIIGDKVWLCEGCTIMSGVKIGDGAIIGAHAFVTSNVPAHAMVSGNPAVIVDEDVLWKY